MKALLVPSALALVVALPGAVRAQSADQVCGISGASSTGGIGGLIGASLDRKYAIMERQNDIMAGALMPAGYASEQAALTVGGRRTLSFREPIGRVEVDREGVIAVSAPSATALRITGRYEGDATVSVFSSDGALLGETRISVIPYGSNAPRLQKVVAVDVQFAAVSSSTLKALGFNFSKLSGDIQGAIVSPSSLGNYTNVPNALSGVQTTAPLQSAFNLFLSAPNRGIGAVLSALQTNGLSQLLAQPTLLVRSGERASFLAGGEVPVPVPQSGGNGGTQLTIEYKKFGVQLSVMPQVISPEQIVLKITPDVSELDYGIGVQLNGYTVPGFRRRCAETTVELGAGQSFVIAGLNFSTSSVSRDKVPFLGDIPVLGAFFKRQQNQKERQELIIVATPRLVDPLRPEDVPPLPSAKVDPSFGDMILGTDGLDQAKAPFGVVRR